MRGRSAGPARGIVTGVDAVAVGRRSRRYPPCCRRRTLRIDASRPSPQVADGVQALPGVGHASRPRSGRARRSRRRRSGCGHRTPRPGRWRRSRRRWRRRFPRCPSRRRCRPWHRRSYPRPRRRCRRPCHPRSRRYQWSRRRSRRSRRPLRCPPCRRRGPPAGRRSIHRCHPRRRRRFRSFRRGLPGRRPVGERRGRSGRIRPVSQVPLRKQCCPSAPSRQRVARTAGARRDDDARDQREARRRERGPLTHRRP